MRLSHGREAGRLVHALAREEPGADADVHNGARALHHVAFEDLTIVTEDHNTHAVVLKVEGHAAKTAAELNHLAGLHLIQAAHAGIPSPTENKTGARWSGRTEGRFRLLGRERWEEREEREERRGRRRAG